LLLLLLWSNTRRRERRHRAGGWVYVWKCFENFPKIINYQS
jgi:hypothetical protein